MDQDTTASSTDETTTPLAETYAGASSSAPREFYISKGKSILTESEFVDIAHLKSRVYQLEQESLTKDFIIGTLEVRVGELEKENKVKNAKI